MSAALLTELKQSGIDLQIDGGNLKAEGPEDKLKEFSPAIRENKAEIIAALAEKKVWEQETVSYIDTLDGLFDVEPYIQDHEIKKLFMDTETTGLDALSDELCLIQIKAGEKVFIVDVGKIGTGHENGFHYSGLEMLLEDKEILKVFQNAVFDLKVLKHQLFPKIRFRNIFDTFLAEKVLTAGTKAGCSLQAIAKRYLNIEMSKEEQTSFKVGQDLSEEQLKYAVNDVDVLPGIFEKQKLALFKAALIPTARLEFSIIPSVVEIDLEGVALDTEKLEKLKGGLAKKCSELHQTLSEMVEKHREPIEGNLFGNKKAVNFNSPKQVKAILVKMGHNVKSTRIETLEKLDSDFARAMIKYRKTSKLLSSFVEPLPKHINSKTGRIHPEFKQMGADTGRFTCENPNLQQIPKEQEWRDLFVARPGYKILTADYSQIELRIMAEFSQDKAFLDAYRKGTDLHTKTAADVFQVPMDQVSSDQRSAAKAINFGLCYGQGSKGLSEKLDISEGKAQEFITAYFKAYPVVKNTLDRLGMKAVKEGHSQTVLGRKRFFQKPDSFGQEKAIERQGRNTPIQSTCGDILKKAIYYIQDQIWNMPAWIINLVHDEIVIEFREDGEEIMRAVAEECMVRAGRDFLKLVPVEVDITVDNVWRK